MIQINDTHPAMVIPELMRILMDEAGYSWDEAWEITRNSVAYTNHTVLSEALERWPQTLIESLLPRIWQIIDEIGKRYQKSVEEFFHHNNAITEKMAVVWGGEVRMANLCIAGGSAVNGVSALHTEILRTDVPRSLPDGTGKIQNVTNGIDHRRWLAQSNPGLHGLICDLTGGGSVPPASYGAAEIGSVCRGCPGACASGKHQAREQRGFCTRCQAQLRRGVKCGRYFRRPG